jgi:hypothetical protein
MLEANVSVNGFELTSALGTVATIGKANVTPTGQSATSALGTPAIDARQMLA